MEQCKCCDPEVGFLCKECSMEKHIYDLKAENARLREALEDISISCENCTEEAQKVLEGKT